MPEKLSYPIFLKLVVAIIGSLFALALGGHIKENGDLNIKNKRFWIVLIFSVSLSIFGGDFVIEHFNLIDKSEQYKRFIYLMIAVFGFLIVGIIYRSLQLTFTDKTLSQIISEIKNITKSLLR